MSACSGGRFEEKVRILDDVLIQRIAARHEKRDRDFPDAVRPVPTAARCWRSYRIAVQDARLQLADVDAELQRVRADDAADFAAAQPSLDLPPQLRQIAAAVAADRFGAELVL